MQQTISNYFLIYDLITSNLYYPHIVWHVKCKFRLYIDLSNTAITTKQPFRQTCTTHHQMRNEMLISLSVWLQNGAYHMCGKPAKYFAISLYYLWLARLPITLAHHKCLNKERSAHLITITITAAVGVCVDWKLKHIWMTHYYIFTITHRSHIWHSLTHCIQRVRWGSPDGFLCCVCESRSTLFFSHSTPASRVNGSSLRALCVDFRTYKIHTKFGFDCFSSCACWCRGFSLLNFQRIFDMNHIGV